MASRAPWRTVWVNCNNVFDAAPPFGGDKQSGWGRERGEEALELYFETKSVVIGLERLVGRLANAAFYARICLTTLAGSTPVSRESRP